MAITPAHDVVSTSPTNTFATLNSIFSSSGTYSNGNLYINADDSDYHFSTISVPVDKIIYFEIIPISTTNREIVGFKTVGNNYTNGDYDIYYYNWQDDDTRRISENGSYISSHLNNDITGKIVGLALDLTGTYINLKMYVNGSLLVNQNTTTTVNSRNNIFPYVRSASGAFTFYLNFGADSSFGGNKTSGSANASDANGIGDFYYAPPTGALALCTANIQNDLAIDPNQDDLPEDFFKVVTYTGNGSTHSISVGQKPDLVWIKDRDRVDNYHQIYDSVRTAGKVIFSNDTLDEQDRPTGLTSFDSNGFSLGAHANNNGNNERFVAWCFRAGGNSNTFNINGTGYSSYDNLQSANSSLPASSTSGMITPSGMSIGTKQGFSIIKYTGTGSAASVPHGLLSAPEMILCKTLEQSIQWVVYHKSTGPDGFLGLNTSDAFNSGDSDYWGSGTGVTDTVFGLQNAAGGNNHASDLIAYCWHSVPGFSAFGSYTGNGSADGPFVYTGFKPAWLLIKMYSGGTDDSWVLLDNVRDVDNAVTHSLYPNLSNSESSVTGHSVDFLSNGFKFRANGQSVNNSSRSYIYAAFAEMPFKYANAR